MTANRFGNWIPNKNRWSLPAPPDFWLEGLHTFDPMLVIVASIASPHYLLARRRQYSAGLTDVAMVDNVHPDTNMLFAHKLMPIAPLMFNGEYLPARFDHQNLNKLLALLRERDTWGNNPTNDPDFVWKNLEYEERREKEKNRANLRQDFFYRGRDAWRSIQARMGWRNKRASEYHGVGPYKVTDRRRVTLTEGGGTAQ